MDLPALLPKSLHYLSKVGTDRDLFDAFAESLEDFILFFEFACDDETWSEAHFTFMEKAIQWMTNRYFEDKFETDFAIRAADKIRDHERILFEIIPKNLTIVLNSVDYPVNSLLWSTSSEFLRTLIIKECRDRNSYQLELEGISTFVFEQVEHHIAAGVSSELWNKSQSEILEVLDLAAHWHLLNLMIHCQELLKKYITSENMFDMFKKCHFKKWNLLEEFCIDFINDRDLGIRFEKNTSDFAMEFLNFGKNAMGVFSEVRRELNRIICGDDLTGYSNFSAVIQDCPNLICVDISQTDAFTDRLIDLPVNLQELNVSKCIWLTNSSLKKLIEICPHLIKISLASNVQLNYVSWGHLKNLSHLQKLDVSHCHQIKDEDFKIILQACRMVTHFYLNECIGLSDNSFFELGKHIPRLSDLDVSRTNISDSGLVDLIMHCKAIIVLNVSRCPNLTDKGIFEAATNAPNLKTLDISKCQISTDTLSKIQKTRPFLHLIR